MVNSEVVDPDISNGIWRVRKIAYAGELPAGSTGGNLITEVRNVAAFIDGDGPNDCDIREPSIGDPGNVGNLLAVRVLVDGATVGSETFCVDNSPVFAEWRSLSVPYSTDFEPGNHTISVIYEKGGTGEMVGSWSGVLTITDESDPGPQGAHTVALDAPQSVVAGEPFDVHAEVCCGGLEGDVCPTEPYTLTLANRTLVETDIGLNVGACEAGAVSAQSVTFDRTGSYTLEATVGQARATQELLVQAPDDPPDDEPPDDPPDDPTPPDDSGNLLPILVGGFILFASQEE